MSTLHALPERFVERLRQIVPAEHVGGVIASFAVQKPTALRVNTLKSSADAAREELAAGGFEVIGVRWLPIAFAVPPQQRRALTQTRALAEGRIYIHNLSSMLAPLVLDPQPGETVLDMCAAPGGKTLQMAAMMNNDGTIAAVEAIRPRLYRLQANIRNSGATIVKTYLTDGRTVGRKTPERFDRVLVDAPCSSEARFTQLDPASWQFWSERKIREMARKQRGLLQAAIHAAKPGGVIVYCTCSLAPEENELIVREALRRFPGALEVAQIELPVNNHMPGLTTWNGQALPHELGRARRILPTEEMDGLFLCKLLKTRPTSSAVRQRQR